MLLRPGSLRPPRAALRREPRTCGGKKEGGRGRLAEVGAQGGGGGREGGGGGGGGGRGGPRCRRNGKFDKSLQRPEEEGAGRRGGPAHPPPAPPPRAPSPDEELREQASRPRKPVWMMAGRTAALQRETPASVQKWKTESCSITQLECSGTIPAYCSLKLLAQGILQPQPPD
ncbi:uncharacterized protein LOC128932429 isoform X1 [Callithrix jacchus]